MAPLAAIAARRRAVRTTPRARASPLVHDCPKGCTTCPVKVIVHKSAIGDPAVCRVCGTKFVVPPWGKTLFPQGKKPTATKPAGKADALCAQLRQEKAALQQHIKQLKASSSEDGATTPKVNLGKLQSILEMAKEAGVAEMVTLAQKNLDDAKKAQLGAPKLLAAIFSKLEKDKRRHAQAVAAVVKGEERLEALKAAAKDATKQLVRTRHESQQLLRIHGHGPGQPEDANPKLHISAPPELPTDQAVTWQQVVAKHAAQAEEAAKLELAAIFPNLLATADMAVDTSGGTPHGATSPVRAACDQKIQKG